MANHINPNSINYKLGQNLARIRKKNGLSQADMEDYLISRSYYGKIELGLFSVTVDKLFLISRAFGCPIKDLFIDENGKPIL